MSFLSFSHLPQARVTAMAVSARYPFLAESLAKLGIQPVLVPPEKFLDDPVASHPDMLLFPLGKNEMVCASEDLSLKSELTHLGFSLFLPERPLEKKYPKDIGLNALSLGDYLFGKTEWIDPLILSNCRKQGKQPVSVRQGYTKCSSCVIDQTHVICSDQGISQAMERLGIRVLTVETKGILLEGYSCGFIGGCAGKIAPDEICFTGSLSSHPQQDQIRDFLKKCGVFYRELSSGPLLDVGSLIPLTESDGSLNTVSTIFSEHGGE